MMTIRMPGRFPAETACLAALAFVLPLFEAPKNILCVLYGLVWLANRVRARDFGGRWDAWDSLIAVWIASGFVVAAGAAVHGGEWRGAVDLVRYGGLLWTVKRARYGQSELRLVLLALVASGIVGLLMGYRDTLVTHSRHWLELNSVGQVNHSSVYLAILLGATVAATAACWGALRAPLRTGAVVVCLFFAGSLVYMASRGAAVAEAAFLLVLATAWLCRSRAAALALVAALAATLGISVALKAGFVQKEIDQEKSNGFMSYRDGIWRLAWEEWKLHPWFGAGMDNYSRISIASVTAEMEARHLSVDRSRYVDAPHAHSLLFNTLAERGVAGALPLAAVLAAWLWSLLVNRPRAQSPPLLWAAWGAAASAWTVTIVGGLVNTTLHHEHGILAALLLGAWLSVLRDGGTAQREAAAAALQAEKRYAAA